MISHRIVIAAALRSASKPVPSLGVELADPVWILVIQLEELQRAIEKAFEKTER